MTLKECTKEELLFIIERFKNYAFSQGDYWLHRCLHDLEYERVRKKLTEAEQWSQVADSCRQKYVAILKKYEGKRLIDIPISEIKEAEQCLIAAEKADKKYDELMKEVDAYGKQNDR